MKYLWPLILLLYVTGSCTLKSEEDKPKSEVDLLIEKTIVLHDTLMLKMGELRNKKKVLEPIIEQGTDSLTIYKAVVQVAKLDAADKAMWDWMHNFDVAYKNKNDSITLNYFKAKLESIRKVEVLFDSAIYQSNLQSN